MTMNSSKTNEKNVRGAVAAARRQPVEVEDPSPEQLAELEREKAELVARLEAEAEATFFGQSTTADEQPVAEQPAEGDGAAVEAVADTVDAQDDVTVGVVSGLQARAGEARAAHEQSDADVLTAAKARLQPTYEAAKLAARKMRSLERQHRSTLDTLGTLDWRYLRQHLVATVWFRRVGEAESALHAVLDGLRNFTATWDRLRDEVNGLTVIKLADRTLVPRLVWELGFLADHPGDMERNKLFRLRQTVTALDAAMKAADGDRVPVSADAAATADTRASSIEAERYRRDPLPADESKMPKQAPGRVKDRNVFDDV